MAEVDMRAAVYGGDTFETISYPADEIRLRVTDAGEVQAAEYRSEDRDGPPAHSHPWHEFEYPRPTRGPGLRPATTLNGGTH